MARNWTAQQKRAIELHNKNILVSAAAGSGKTAVLVERIIRMITDPDNHVDIERLVVVTFTNAAAAQMRERIGAALESMIEENPSDRNLQRQLAMIHMAQITTIDSFCLNILRNNYMNLDIDPGFRIADQGELELIKADVMGELLEKYYAGGNEDFYALINSYSGKKSDKAIEDLINKIYNYARSYPWPHEWLQSCIDTGSASTVDEFNESLPAQYLFDYVTKYIQGSREKFRRLLDICKDAAGPDMYIDNILSDLEGMDMLLNTENISQWMETAARIQFTDLSRKRGSGVDPDMKELVRNSRTKYRDSFRKLRDRLCSMSVEEYLRELSANGAPLRMLITLASEYIDAVDAAKKEKNIIDFNDIEHMACSLLVKHENDTDEYTQLADDLASYYGEILIDEYQDSNMLQEMILTAVSRGRLDSSRNNLFMVGDVKQSIYKFRLARPELFLDKYVKYPDADGCEVIELRNNFRSRSQVLYSVNSVFEKIMHRECGGIEYTEDVRLNPGLEFAQRTDSGMMDNRTSIRLADLNIQYDEDDVNTPRECEGRLIASIIKEVIDEDTGMPVYDERLGTYRKAEYGDIVVLTRSLDGWADVFADELMNAGIPAAAQSSSGYYDTYEIEQVLNLLAVIDNPAQDIPLAAVALSYFGTLDVNDLALVKSAYPDARLYESMNRYLNSHADNQDEICAKINNLLTMIEGYRTKSVYLTINELIWKIIYDTGFYDYVGMMPAGSMRQQNLDMLCDKAESYARTSYHGLFNFLRYIEKIRKYNLDSQSGASDMSDNNAVQIMSIHKSKGLEFPIVIVAGIAKKFNNMDARGRVVVDSDIGVGADIIDTVMRTKVSTPVKSAVEMKLVDDNLAEEMRILYVAMTRAKEKLIMTGTLKNYDKMCAKWKTTDVSTFDGIQGCSSYMDMIMPVACGDAVNFDISVTEINKEPDEDEYNGDKHDIMAHNAADIHEAAKKGAVSIEPYRYGYAVTMKTKLSVSEIKLHEYEEQEEFTRDVLPELNAANNGKNGSESGIEGVQPAYEPCVPQFISKKEEVAPAERGTAFHRVMECLDYNRCGSVDDIRGYIDELVDRNMMTRRQADAVNPQKVYDFCNSSIGARTAEAFRAGRLYREQPFVMGIPAGSIKIYQELADRYNVSYSLLDEETVLIQGVIDMYFEENGKVVLVDYKTDRVSGSNAEKILRDHYAIQLELYSEALERALGMEVSEKLIYSFTLDKAVNV